MTLASSDQMNIPIIDGDFMVGATSCFPFSTSTTSLLMVLIIKGRAYPTGWQVTPNVYDLSGRSLNILPAAIASGDGNHVVRTFRLFNVFSFDNWSIDRS